MHKILSVRLLTSFRKLSFFSVLVFLLFISSAYFVFADATLFNTYPTNPVFSYSAVSGSFDENQIRGATVVDIDGLFHMYYTALGSNNSMTIGLATSADGANWSRYSSTPIFRCGDNSLNTCTGNVNWSSYRVIYPSVMFDEGIYKMWYTGDPANGPSQMAVGYATSSDGLTWDAYNLNPIFPGTQLGTIPNNGFIMRGVTKLDGEYYMYYYRVNNSGAHTYVATSSDGVHWEEINDHQPVLLGDVTYLGTINSIVYLNQGDLLYAAADGLSFESVSNTLMTGDPLLDVDNGTMLLRDNTVHMWRSKFIGNIHWGGGNAVINYYTASSTILLNTQPINNPPELAPIGNQTINENQTLTFTVSATDPDGDSLTYTAANLPGGATFNTQTAEFSWTPGYADAGNYENIEFSVMDDGAPMEVDVELITITVGDINRAPEVASVGAQEVLEGDSLQFTILATDPDNDTFTLEAISLPVGASFDTQTGVFSWTPSLSQEGIYTVTFTATDSGTPAEAGFIDVAITVGDNPTPIEQSEDIIEDVINYDFPTNIENSYMANLQKVAQFIEQGKIQAAINQLEAFINKVNQDYVQNKITQAERDSLVDAAEGLIADLD